jgi:hypothetical protein
VLGERLELRGGKGTTCWHGHSHETRVLIGWRATERAALHTFRSLGVARPRTEDSRDLITIVEDAGDGLHGQRNALDSGWIFDVTKDYSKGLQPVRWLAEGRDPSATLDSAAGGFGKNEGDNEITGVLVSNGDPGPQGLLGARNPNLWNSGGEWRWFWTQQHGDNFTWQVELAK